MYRLNARGTGGSYGGSGGYYTNPQLVGVCYGNAGVFPLLGGSGGSSDKELNSGGGAGGGAILIATPGTTDITGQIQAIGGNGCDWGGSGSGGAIRLICDTLAGGTTGRLYAHGGTGGRVGGAGRIRVEANEVALEHQGNPAYSLGLPGSTARICPDSTAPRIRAVTLGDQSVPAEPMSRFDPQHDVNLDTPAAVTLVLDAENVPLDWVISVRVVPRHGEDQLYTATFVSGDASFSTWEAQIPALPYGFSAIQARASKP